MSDPLSITGSAVGVISLGLYLCGEIARYAQNVQGQTDDMQYLATKATNIRSLLKNLRELIDETKNDLPDVAEDLESKVLGLQLYLDRLKRPIEKYEQAQAATKSVRARARSTLNKAIYHFKKEELFEVRDCLQSMEIDLTAALDVYSARELRRLGLKQDIFGFKQDLLIQKMDTLQLSITATSHQTLLQEPTTHSISCRGSFRVQSCRPSLGYNWKNFRTTQERKQYRLYRIFPIASLHCHAVVDSESWLGTFAHERRIFGRPGLADLTARELSEELDNWITLFQRAAEEGKMRLTDEIMLLYESPLSAMDFTFRYIFPCNLDTFPGIRKFVTYMLHHNVTTNYRDPLSALRRLCHAYIWTEQELDLASYIIEKCGPINWAPRSWIEKINMQCLLRRHGDSIDLPSEFLAVLRESETDLRGLLELKLAPSKDSLDGITLLQLAMGWPVGVKLLMKAQPGILIPRLYHSFGITDEDDKIDEYADCSNILHDAGYMISNYDITLTSSKKLRSLFIRELAKRRRKLLDIAEARIQRSELLNLRKGEIGLPDAYAPALWAALISKGHEMDQSLRPFEKHSLFCGYRISPDILNEIYEAGFVDLDLPLEREYTPLMVHCENIYDYSDLEIIAWMISKGASVFRTLPGSNTTTLHLLNSNLARWIHRERKQNELLDPHVGLRHLQQIETHLLSLSTRDRCYCSCSADGCTPFSVAMRDVIFGLYHGWGQHISQVASSFRRLLEFLIDHNQSKLEVCRAMIRSLTFDGLSLSHTCCTELRIFPPWEHVREESDLQEIREEQKVPLERFEKLVSELDAQFDESGLPLMDFLQEIWYERMVKFISERDKYDLKHNEETRKLGISLEVDEIKIPLVVQFICDQVRVVESDSDDS